MGCVQLSLKRLLNMKNTTAYSHIAKEKKQMIDILTDYWKEKNR